MADSTEEPGGSREYAVALAVSETQVATMSTDCVATRSSGPLPYVQAHGLLVVPRDNVERILLQFLIGNLCL